MQTQPYQAYIPTMVPLSTLVYTTFDALKYTSMKTTTVSFYTAMFLHCSISPMI